MCDSHFVRSTVPELLAEPDTSPPKTTRKVQDEDQSDPRLSEPWRVVLFNDEIHTFEEVINQVVKATGCSLAEAEQHAWRAHFQGKTGVFDGAMDSCLKVQGVLREIALVTEIQG